MSALRLTACERARGWCSLAVDCELSELERRLLESHLDRCPACSSYFDTVRWFTEELREERPLEFERQIEVRRRPRRLPGVRVLAPVVAAAAGAAIALVAAAQTPRQVLIEPAPLLAPHSTLANNAFDDARAQRLRLVTPKPAPLRTRVNS